MLSFLDVLWGQQRSLSKRTRRQTLLLSMVSFAVYFGFVCCVFAEHNASNSDPKHRVVVSTDIGGTDPDDYQSMVHLLVYADQFEIEGLISSPFGPGRQEHILDVIDRYAEDYPRLRAYSSEYPSPEHLRTITKQGETQEATFVGIGKPTDGSRWIAECAKKPDERPLFVLVWGGLEDLAQALHDAPEIESKLRVYWIGGPNKKWSPNAYQYLVDHFPNLWIIESNSTYRGWFHGGDQSGRWSNRTFVANEISGRGALGRFFTNHLNGSLKMGDSPSVGWLIRGNPSEPDRGGWGGLFVRTGNRPIWRVDRLTSEDSDSIAVFGILELRLAVDEGTREALMDSQTQLVVENQSIPAYVSDERQLCFRFCPKESKVYSYEIRSWLQSINGKRGSIRVTPPMPENILERPPRHSHWWTDSLAPEHAEGIHFGAKTINVHRHEYLRDFAERMSRCQQ